MASTLRKWHAIFSIYFQEGLAYRASGLIWIMTDLTTAITMPLVWARANTSGAIHGFGTGDFVLYYLCQLLISSFVTSHIMWEVAGEIREGTFNTALLRPISFYQVSFFRNLSWRFIRTALFFPIFCGLIFAYRGYLGGATWHLGPEFWLSVVLGHLVSFTFVMAMAMIALFIQEAMSVFELYYVPMIFLSGQLFPIAVLPDWARALARFFPFYYTTGAPTEILIGKIRGSDVGPILLTQVVWIVVSVVIGKALWKLGLRQYAGVGM